MLIRHTVCRFLEERGYTVESATNGEEALPIVNRIHPDIIITDMQMPKMTGTELITALKAQPETAKIPIVIVAGMITGCAGGVLRDILCNDVPLLFRSELYASVSVVTGLFYATTFRLSLHDEVWTALTFALGLTLRLLAIRYKWEMPKFVFNGDR